MYLRQDLFVYSKWKGKLNRVKHYYHRKSPNFTQFSLPKTIAFTELEKRAPLRVTNMAERRAA